jgi:glutathione synthase/RimK-type ligase-like ATP-grasp enzyme
MAIFSQGDAQTRVDMRVYNHARPNRMVPARLPAAVTAAIVRFMEMVGLKTGSLDLIRTHDGRHLFLEVNPGGQFGMVSEPCNYYLEREVAQYLLRKDRGERD